MLTRAVGFMSGIDSVVAGLTPRRSGSLRLRSDECIYRRLTKIFRDVFDDESLVPTPAMTAKNVVEWGSLNDILMMVAIEKAFRPAVGIVLR
jgi:hypothetical protein